MALMEVTFPGQFYLIRILETGFFLAFLSFFVSSVDPGMFCLTGKDSGNILKTMKKYPLVKVFYN